MGLIYSSSESAQLIAALKKNLQSGKEASEQLKSGSQKVIAAVDGKTLSGAAYTAGKGLFSDLILPTISKVTSALDEVEQELQTYTNADGKVASEGNLDEDKLTRQIATKKAMKASVEASASVARSLSRNNPVAKILDALLNVEASLNRMATEYEQDIQELQEKLEKLRQFSSETSGLFSNSLNNMNIAMQGCLVLSNTTINSDGSYKLPEGTDKSWFTSLQNKQADYGNIIAVLQGTATEFAGDQIEKNLGKAGAKYEEKLSSSIWSNRYSITMPDGRILGQVPGATAAARESIENTAKGVSKYFGKALTEVGGTFIGVGIDLWQGDSAEEAWGKEITTGIAAVGVTGAIELGSAALVSAGVLANPIGVGIVGAIGIGIGVGLANDWLRDNFKGVKDFEDSVGNAVVSGWNKLSDGVGDFIGGIFSW